MPEFSVDDAARALTDAADSGTPIPPLTATYEDLSLDQAYEVQHAQVQTAIAGGRVITGYKVGLTSAAIQRQLGVDQPDFGHLFGDMFIASGQPIDITRFIAPKVEPEFAFVLGRDLSGPGVTTAEAASAVESVCGALEIIDSRIEDWRISLADTVADNASCGAVVLGDRFLPLSAVDLRTQGVVLSHQGEVAETGAGAAVLGSPLAALAWVANTLGERGVTMSAGSVVLPGSMTAAVPVAAGSAISAEYTDLGTVTARFTA